MPNCFQLLSKETGKADSFCEIDEKLCANFDWPVDPVSYAYSWYDILGLGLACGRSFEDLRGYCTDEPELLQIIDWLDEHYTSDSWCESRR